MASDGSGRGGGEAARNLALINYGLLSASIFFAGVPALIAVVIAYSQRGEAPAAIASHHAFQIRIFWTAFVMSLAAGVCLLVAAVSGLIELTRGKGWGSLEAVTIDLSRLTLDGAMIGLLLAAAALSFLAALWLVAAPAFGAIRLASTQPIGHSPAS